MENQIAAWLKADIMVGYLNKPDEIFHAMEGTPQGGIISPLLANIALHGMEEYIKEWYAKQWYPFTGLSRKVPMRDRKASIGFSRYADDFVITAPRCSDIEQIGKQVAIWLSEEAGLELSQAKTRIVNSTEGFEFLGFHFISIKSVRLGDVHVGLKLLPSHQSGCSCRRQTNRARGSSTVGAHWKYPSCWPCILLMWCVPRSCPQRSRRAAVFNSSDSCRQPPHEPLAQRPGLASGQRADGSA